MSRVVLMTGATGGIGQATAVKLASQGYMLQLHYHTKRREAERLQKELVDRYGVEVTIHHADLSQPEGVQTLLDSLVRQPDILIYNAGMPHASLFTEVSPVEYERMIQLQLTSPFQLVQSVLASMVAQHWGRIVFVTSIWGETGASYEVLYSMVKGGLNALTKALAKELAPTGITVNAVSPGAIDTPLLSSYTADQKDALAKAIPVGRLGQPEEVAHAIHFLIQEESSYITGDILRVNGGWLT